MLTPLPCFFVRDYGYFLSDIHISYRRGLLRLPLNGHLLDSLSSKQLISQAQPIMAPTEAAILHNYLTVPAQLPSAITLEEFTELFPKPHRANPQIRSLYRDLQHQRRALVDTITENIENEEKNGRVIKREIARAQKRAKAEDADQELEIERAVRFCDYAAYHHDRPESLTRR